MLLTTSLRSGENQVSRVLTGSFSLPVLVLACHGIKYCGYFYLFVACAAAPQAHAVERLRAHGATFGISRDGCYHLVADVRTIRECLHCLRDRVCLVPMAFHDFHFPA